MHMFIFVFFNYLSSLPRFSYRQGLHSEEHQLSERPSPQQDPPLQDLLPTNGQLHATHVILGFTLISTHIQSLKHVIKTHNPRLARIDIEVKEFIAAPHPKGTLQVQLTTQQVAHLIQSKEEPIPSKEEEEKVMKEPSLMYPEEDFTVFDQPCQIKSPEASSKARRVAQVSVIQEAADRLVEGMVIQN